MAVVKVHVRRQRLDTLIAYVTNPEKTRCEGFHSVYGIKDTLTSGFKCSCDEAYSQMLETKEHFHKKDKVQGFHFIQSFKPGETTPEQAHQIGCEFIERCFGNDFEVVIGTHTDRAHIHNHIIVNSVSFVDGYKYRSTPQTLYELRSISDELCREHGLSVIDNPRVKAGKHYAEWRAEQENRPTVRGMIREDIDIVIAQAHTLNEFWDMLRARGYEIRINDRRKYITVRHPKAARFIRLRSLGEEYIPRRIAERIAAQRGVVDRNIRQLRTQWQDGRQRKKYRVQPHTPAPRSRKKLRGFRALYWRYLYMLGKVKKRKAPRYVRGELMAELKKLNRYAAQYYFLRDNKLQTAKEVSMYADALANEVDILTDRRARLYADLRRPGAEEKLIRSTAGQITNTLRDLRKQQRMCAAIQTAVPAMEAKLAAALKEEKTIYAKTTGGKQYESRKRGGGPDAPHGTHGDRIRSETRSEGRGQSRGTARGGAPQRETDCREK